MSKHQSCRNCHRDFVGPDSGIGENLCPECDAEIHSECRVADAEDKRCNGLVWGDGPRASAHTCPVKNGKYFEDGKWWCGTHSPSKVAARREAAAKIEKSALRERAKAAHWVSVGPGLLAKAKQAAWFLDGDRPLLAKAVLKSAIAGAERGQG